MIKAKGVIIITENIITNILNLDERDIEKLETYQVGDVLYIDLVLKRKDIPCPACGSHSIKVKEYKAKEIKHSIFQFKKCVILYHARRYVCVECGKTFYEDNPFSKPGSIISNLTILNVLTELKETNSTFSSVARHNSLSLTKVQTIFDSYVDIPRQPLTEILCIDEVYTETSINNKYSCLILDFKTHRLLDIIKDRKKYTLLDYFEKIPKAEREKVEYIIMDMYETYRTVARRRLPNAKIAVDSFHVIKNYTELVDSVRKRIMKKYKKKDKEYYLLKKFNWLLLIDEPKENERRFNRRLNRYINYPELLECLLSISDELRKVYELKSEYLYINRDCTFENIERYLDAHLQTMKESSIPEVLRFRKTMNKWYEEIVTSFIVIDGRRLSNGIMESRNGIAKKVKNNANGYTNHKRYRNRCLYVMNKDIRPSLSESVPQIKMKGQKRGKYKIKSIRNNKNKKP